MNIRLITFALLGGAAAAFAQITIPGDGSDGALTVANSTNFTINLAQAVTAAYDANNSANAGKGVYDASKRAVVFKYTSVTIGTNSTVNFINHPTHSPVVWLVQGNVTIGGNSTVNLNGANVSYGSLVLSEPGPGGFRGGVAASTHGAGLGPGGSNYNGSAAQYASVYGNPSILPLIGGSGGGGGGGGGGAILIAASGTITVNGSIVANGGSGNTGGSGGAIRLVANALAGTGTLTATPDGRVRLEANSLSGSISTSPQTVAVSPQVPPVIWPPSTAPTVKIIKVDTQTVSANPTANLDISADVGVSTNSTVTVIARTQNFAVSGGVVQVRSAGKFSDTATWTTAIYQTGDDTQADWIAVVPCPSGFTTLQARATRP